MGPRVYDGSSWININPEDISNPDGAAPMKPILDEDNGRIFVSIPSYRDPNRCANTIDALFKNAEDPDKVFVGLVEQNKDSEPSCIVKYCEKYGAKVGAQKRFFDPADGKAKCPHYSQIRFLAIFNIAAKGPAFARSLHRKILGDEEFCLQIDAHSDFTKDWDKVLKEQWLMTENEYAIISTKPAPIQEKQFFEMGGSRANEVLRLCHAGYHPEGIPWFYTDQKALAQDLEKPLLSTAWNAGFSFSKCHLEESAPYDPFIPLLFDLEEFPRFARFWTRGYDVYTPTRNIVYHEYSPPEGVEPRGYPRLEQLRRAAVIRIKTLLQLKGGKETEIDQANLGLYGLGERRSLSALESFVGIVIAKRSADFKNKCGGQKWVPYDLSMSPLENLFDHPDDLDPQPEYPLRQKGVAPVKNAEVADVISDLHPHIESWEEIHKLNEAAVENASSKNSSLLLFVAWIFGLVVWYKIFVGGNKSLPRPKKKKLKSGGLGMKEV